nr:hypothetical protein [Wolbachia endosymbiont of Atemnus politus]
MVEGVARHNGPLLDQNAVSHISNQLLLGYNKKYDLTLEEFISIEAQVASIADDIAYGVHDLDDALRANLVTVEDLFDIPLIGETLKDVKSRYSKLPKCKLIHESLSRTIGIMISDVVSQTKKNIENLSLSHKIKSVEDVRSLNKMLVTFSLEVANATKEMKKFNMEKIYRSYKLNITMNKENV